MVHNENSWYKGRATSAQLWSAASAEHTAVARCVSAVFLLMTLGKDINVFTTAVRSVFGLFFPSTSAEGRQQEKHTEDN